jgi:hypothetical protein
MYLIGYIIFLRIFPKEIITKKENREYWLGILLQ